MTPDVSTMGSVDMLCFLGVTGRNVLLPRYPATMTPDVSTMVSVDMLCFLGVTGRNMLMLRRDVSGGAMRVDEETT